MGERDEGGQLASDTGGARGTCSWCSRAFTPYEGRHASRMRAIVLGSVTSPITRSCPPQLGHTLRSIPNTLLSRAIQVMGAVDASFVFSLCSVLMGEVCRGTMR